MGRREISQTPKMKGKKCGCVGVFPQGEGDCVGLQGEISQTPKMKGEKCGCVGIASNALTSVKLGAIQASKVNNSKP